MTGHEQWTGRPVCRSHGDPAGTRLQRRRSAASRLLGAALLAASSGCAGPPAGVTISEPQERQVLQRDAAGAADLVVRGTLPVGGSHGAAVRAALAGGQFAPWVPVVAGEQVGEGISFTASLRLPAGGWHRLELRAGPGAPPRTVVERVGVGEVFVVAGQSNSANSSMWRMPGVNDRVSAFDGRRWSRATDPMPGVQDGSDGGSPWPVLGDMLARALDLPVAFASTGFGGSSVADWQPGAPPVSPHVSRPLYPELRRRVAALGSVRAVLWHQGETDAYRGMDGDTWYQLFRNLQEGLRRDAGKPVPWMVARVSFLPGLEMVKREPIRRAQERLWAAGHALRGPSTDELQGSLRGPDHTHFSGRGLRVHAELWFAALWSEIFADLPAGAAAAPD